MAVTVDAVGPAGGGGTNGSSGAGPWTHTCSGSNRAVVVGVSVENTTFSATTLTVTYDGVAMTSFGAINSNNNTAGFVQLFGLVNPPTGAKNVVVVASPTAGQNVIAGSVSFNGVDQTTPFGSGVTAAGDNSGGSNPPRRTVSSATGDMVVDAICYGAALNGSLGTQQVLDNNSTASAAGNLMLAAYAGAATVTAGANPTNLDWWGIVAVDVKAAAGGPTPISVSEAGTSAETATVTATAPLAQTGSSAEALAASAAVPVAEAGSSAEAVTAAAAVPLGQTGSSAEALTAAAAVPIAEAAASTEALAITAAVSLADAGSGADALSVSGSGNPSVGEAGAAGDVLSAGAAVPIADGGAGGETFTVAAGASPADAGSAADTLSVVVAAALAEAGAALTTLGAGAALQLGDGGSAATDLAGPGAITFKFLTDVGDGCDSLCVLVPRPTSGTVNRPSTGSAARPGSGTVARPNTGIITRPDTGHVHGPGCGC